MPCAKNPQEAKIIHRLVRPTLRSTHTVRRQCLFRKLALARPRHRIGSRESTKPIADPVGIAGPDDRGDARLDDVGKLAEEGTGIVACGGEFLVGCIGALLVGGFGADGLNNICVGQVVGICFWRIGVVGWRPDVVDVEIARLGERPFNAVVAGVDAVDTVGIGACTLTFRKGWGALRVVSVQIAIVLGLGDESFVAIAEAKVDVRLFLELSVEPAIVDAKGDERDVLPGDAVSGNSGVLLFEVVGELRPIMAAIGFGEYPELPILVLRELSVKGL